MLEVSEKTMLADNPAVTRALGALKRSGVRIAIDDFGTGYSSLAHLTFEGDSSEGTIVDGGGTSRLFQFGGGTLIFRDLTLRNGAAIGDTDLEGGAIEGPATLTIERARVVGNTATGYGGAVSAGNVTIIDSSFVDNTGGTDVTTPTGRIMPLRRSRAAGE